LRLSRCVARRSVGHLHYAYRICIIGVEFEPDKAAENLRKHRVSFAHAEQALRDPAAVTVEDPDAEGEPRFVTLEWMPWAEPWWLYTPRVGGGRASYLLERPARSRH
jgi:uncharacterized DUF497 family protein